MYAQSIRYYDQIYAGKDYSVEAAYLREVIAAHQRSAGRRLLDVACGTGRHLEHLKTHFAAEGLDISSLS